MPDVFDSLSLEPSPPRRKPDIFDALEAPPAPPKASKGDIFDQLEAPAAPLAPPAPAARPAEPLASPAPVPAPPVPAAVERPPVPVAPNLSLAMNAYRRALVASQQGDAAGIETNLAEALRLDPSLPEAQNMRDRLAFMKNAGRPLETLAAPEAAPAPAPGPVASQAAAAASAVRAALPVPAPANLRLPRTPQEAVEAALLPILSLSAPIRSEEGQRLAGAAGAGVAGSAGSMAAAVPALEAFAGVETPAGKIAQRAAAYLGALAQDLMPDDPNFAEHLASGAGSMALFMVPGAATGKVLASVPRMGVLAARLAPALGVGLPVVLESATESGGVFQRALLAGQDREEAGQAAAKAFLGNAILIGLTNRLGLNAEGRSALAKALTSAPMEAIQEAGQTIISDLSAGDPVDWADVAVSAGVGGIIGAGTGALFQAAGAPAPAAAIATPAGQEAPPAPPARAAAGAPPPPPPPPEFQAAPATGAPGRLADVPAEVLEPLAERFPSVVQAMAQAGLNVPRVTFNAAATSAMQTGEQVLGETRDPVAADAAALQAFQRAAGIQPAPAAADVFDTIELPETEQPAAPETPETEPAEALEEGARQPEPRRAGAGPSPEDVLAYAKAMHRQALAERDSKVSPLERFITEIGGVRGIKREGEEFQAVPVHLRGPVPLDEAETDARAAGFLRPNEDLYTAIQRLPRRGPRPALTDFIDQARRELENEYEIYGAPRERLQSAPSAGEEVPFERGPEYSAAGPRPEGGFGPKEGPPRAEFAYWQLGYTFGPNKPYFNIRGEHPQTGSTKSAESLEKLGIAVPEFPTFEDWEKTRTREGAAPYGQQTETPEFKKWFGKSKVVDAEGKPLVVYHGTDADFAEFRKSENRMADRAAAGFWFSTEPSDAGRYGKNTVQAFLSIKKPKKIAQRQLDFLAASEPMSQLRAKWEAQGFDGLFIEPISEDRTLEIKAQPGQWVAFHPEQIKSATANSGAFSPNDPNILRERQPGLFGGREGTGKGKPEAEGQLSLFGPMARPQFELPKPNAQAQRLAKTEEGRHQVPMQVPAALQESVVIKDLAEQGFLAVPKMRIEGPEDTAAIFHFLKNQTVESLYVLSMDENDQILGAELVSVGILDSAMAHPRDTLKGATLLGAKRIALVHNHPSGNPTPSTEDLKMTRKFAKAAASVGMELKHHVVINDTEFGVIEQGGAGEWGSALRQRGEAPAGEGGQARLVKPVRSSAATGQSIKTPAAAVEFAKAFQTQRGGVVALALDTNLRPTGVWYMGNDFQGVEAMAADVGRIAMRNNAHSVIFAAARMPSKAYIRALHDELLSTWDIPVVDVAAPEGGESTQILSAHEAGMLRDEPQPYGAGNQPGAKPEAVLRAVKRVEKARAEDMKKVRLPSRQGMPAKYTEAQAMRIGLRREARAASAAYARGKKEAWYSSKWFEAERNRIKRDIANKVEEMLPLAERGRFVKMIADAKTPKDLAKAAARMDEALERFQKRTLIGRVKRQMERVVASKAIAVDYVGRIKGVMSDVLLQKPRPDTLRRLAETQRVITQAQANGQRVEVPQYVLDKIKALAAKPLADMHLEQIEDLLDQIKRLADLGKTKLEAMRAIDSAQKEADIADLMAGSEPIASKEEARARPGEELPLPQRLMNTLRRAFNRAQTVNYAITPMDVIFDVLDDSANYSGPNYRIFKARVDNAFGSYIQEAARMKDEARALANRLGLTEKNMERIGVFAMDVQEGGRQKLYNNGLSDEEIGAIRLTPAEAGFYRFMRENLDRLRPRIAETMRRVYNAELGQVPNYFPFVTDWDQMSEQDVRDRMLTEMTGLRKNAEMGFTKERKGPGQQKVDLDALGVYLKHVDDVAYLVNVGPVAKYLGELAGSELYQLAAGNVGQRIVREWVDTVARKGGGLGDQQIRVLDFLRKNTGLAALGLRLTSAAIQPTSILQGGALIGPRVFQGMGDLARSRRWRQFVLDAFPELRDRAGDDIAFLDFNGEGVRDKAGRMVMWPLQKLDILAARSVAAGAYRKYLADRDLPLDLDNPNKDAIAYAQRIVRRTQSSSSFKDAPQALTRGRLTGNRSLDRALLQFQSFMLNNWSMLTHEGLRAGVAKGRVTQSANVALWSTMAVMAAVGLRDAVKDLMGADDDEREYWEKVAREALGNVPFVSNIIGTAAYGATFPALDIIKRTIQGGHRMAAGQRPETRVKGAVDLASGLATIAGVPVPTQLTDVAKRAAVDGAGASRRSRQARPARARETRKREGGSR